MRLTDQLLNVQKPPTPDWWQPDVVQETEQAQEIERVELQIDSKVAFILYNVFSPAECEHFIAQTEQLGYRPMPEYSEGYRSNTRVIVDDESLERKLWGRVRPFIPATFNKDWQAYGGLLALQNVDAHS